MEPTASYSKQRRPKRGCASAVAACGTSTCATGISADQRDTCSYNQQKSKTIIPTLSAACVFGCLAALMCHRYEILPTKSSVITTTAAWLPNTYSSATATMDNSNSQRRLLFLQDFMDNVMVASKSNNDNNGDPSDVNDDITRDETCKEYMSKFLNGTTDFKDECQGMYNAYQAADCAEDTKTVILSHDNKKKHHKKDDKKNDTNTDDDVMIDDFYEQWECCSSIYEYYNTHCHEPELDSGLLLSIVGVLVVCSMVKSFLHSGLGWEWLPDAAIFIMVGAITGGICRLIAPDIVAQRLTFNNDLFLHILLPPIVFQAALKIDKRSFRRDIFPILSFAVLGTVFSAVAVGFITYYLTKWGPGTSLPLLDSLMFGSLISSIDPVATLGILSSVGVSQRDTLYTLIFGESLLNDGVAIVLFDVLVKHLGDPNAVTKATAMEILGGFFGIAFGSILVGVVCGACCAIYFYNLWGKHTAVTEVAIFFSWALIPFYISDMLSGSGIISIMTMGFFLDYYVIGGNQSEEGEWMDFMQFRCHNARIRSEGNLTGSNDNVNSSQEPVVEPSRCEKLKLAWKRAFSGRGHILSKSRHHVGFVAEVIADIMETGIFCYLGLFLFNDNSQWSWKLNVIAIFGCVSSRLGMVILISAVINLFVFCDLEGILCGCCRKIWSDLNCDNQTNLNRGVHNSMSAPLLGGHYDDPPTGDDDDDDDASDSSESKRFLDVKTQAMLLLAGIRGAVSFALVTNLPVYNVVTKRGSQYKAELKAMTSASILFTLFVFGALTYFIVRKEQLNPNRERVVGYHTHRLSSVPLASDNEGEDDESDALDSSAMVLEMEENPLPRRHPLL